MLGIKCGPLGKPYSELSLSYDGNARITSDIIIGRPGSIQIGHMSV